MTELLTVVIFVVFDVPALLTVVSAAVTGRLVRRDPSPTKRPNILPAEIVEKKPNEVDIDTAEILDTARRKLTALLTVVIFALFVVPVLLTVVSAAVTGRLVRRDPSPTKRPNILPAEIVEKKPNEVDIDTAEILDTARRKLTALLTVVIFALFVVPVLLTVVSAAVTGRLVRRDPSPTKRPNILPAEIVEKKP